MKIYNGKGIFQSNSIIKRISDELKPRYSYIVDIATNGNPPVSQYAELSINIKVCDKRKRAGYRWEENTMVFWLDDELEEFIIKALVFAEKLIIKYKGRIFE